MDIGAVYCVNIPRLYVILTIVPEDLNALGIANEACGIIGQQVCHVSCVEVGKSLIEVHGVPQRSQSFVAGKEAESVLLVVDRGIVGHSRSNEHLREAGEGIASNFKRAPCSHASLVLDGQGCRHAFPC